MRIISGSLRGKKLFTPKTDNIRPTTDRTREAIYNILYSKLKTPLTNCQILDIFSGTGAFGLEALSRGAQNACFVDIDLNLTQKNIKLCGFTNVSFKKCDARKLPQSPTTFDIVFMDAPYKQDLSLPVLENLLAKNYLSPSTLIIVELAKDESISLPSSFSLIDERIYGISKVLFLELNPNS